jgi:hypothetical protein
MFPTDLLTDVDVRHRLVSVAVDHDPAPERPIEVDVARHAQGVAGPPCRRRTHGCEHDHRLVVFGHDDVVDVLVPAEHETVLEAAGLALDVPHTTAADAGVATRRGRRPRPPARNSARTRVSVSTYLGAQTVTNGVLASRSASMTTIPWRRSAVRWQSAIPVEIVGHAAHRGTAPVGDAPGARVFRRSGR